MGRWEGKGSQGRIGHSMCTSCLVCCVRSLWGRVYLRLEVARAGLAEVDHTFVACAAQSQPGHIAVSRVRAACVGVRAGDRVYSDRVYVVHMWCAGAGAGGGEVG